jgi:hypothetical protein
MRARRKYRKSQGTSGNVAVGALLLLVGGLLLSRELGANLPDWLFRWEMILVAVGIGVAIKSKFRDFGWIIILGVAFFFLADDLWPGMHAQRFIIPAVILSIGLLVMFNRTWFKSSREDEDLNRDFNQAPPIVEQPYTEQFKTEPSSYGFKKSDSPDEYLDVVSIFSAVNKKIFSKNFGGGDIVCIFGGTEINLMNADIAANEIVLDMVNIFGGATLFVPPNWHVKSEIGSVFGGIDDKRRHSVPDQNKTIIVKGVIIFGGLEIKSLLR